MSQVYRQRWETIDYYGETPNLSCHACGRTLNQGEPWTRLRNIGGNTYAIWGQCCAGHFPNPSAARTLGLVH